MWSSYLIRWWHSTIHFRRCFWFLCQHPTLTSENWPCFQLDVFKISFHWIKLNLSFSLLVYLHSSLKSLSSLHSCLLMQPSCQPTQLWNRGEGIIFDSTLSMSHHISSVLKSCFSSVRDLLRIRNTLDFTTAHTIATSLIHSKLDNCNSLFMNLPQSQLSRLQLILNSTTQAVSKTQKFLHITTVLKSFNWLKIEHRIQYRPKVTSLAYKTPQSNKPDYLIDLLHIQRNRNKKPAPLILSLSNVLPFALVWN